MVRSGRVLGALSVLALALACAADPARAQQGDIEAQLGEKVLLKVPVGGGPEIAMEEILRDVGERFKVPITIDDALKGKKIKFYTSAEINYNVLRAILQSYQVELVWEQVDGAKILHAYQQRNVAQNVTGATPFFNEGEKLPGTEQVVTAVYQVKYADANGIQTAIRALMTRDQRRVGNIVQVPKSDIIILTDFTSAVDFYIKVAKALDQPLPTFTYKIVQVQYAAADELAQLITTLQRTLDTGGAAGSGQPGQPPSPRPAPGAAGAGPGQAQVVADVRTNKVVILALPNDIAAIEKLIHEMDVKVDPPPRHFHVYKCINANAAELADRLNQLFGGAVGQTFGGQRRTGTTTPTTGFGGTTRFGTSSRLGSSRYRSGTGLDRFGVTGGTPQPATTPPATGGVTAPRTTLNPGEQGLLETRIVPDDQTNSLLIQAMPDDYREILAILKELDKKRLRVLIEAQVWEIAVSDDLFFAIESAYTDDASTNTDPNPMRGHGIMNFGLLAPTVTDDANTLQLLPNLTAGSPLASGGLIFALTKGGFDRIPLIIQALATDSNANLLTTPFALTNDNEEATFLIEQNAPFQVATSTSVSAFQGFDFATATSQLSITPRISSGNNLTLTIQLDIQSFTEPPQGNRPPPSNARSYAGTVTVPNRQYVVFGGLEQESVTEARRKIPLLGDIPILGYLFGSTTYRKERRRIYVFVRPVIFTDENFENERKASRYAHDSIRASSLLGPDKTNPIIPDDVLDAEAPGIKATLYRLFGDGGQLGMPEDARTRAQRKAIAEQK